MTGRATAGCWLIVRPGAVGCELQTGVGVGDNGRNGAEHHVTAGVVAVNVHVDDEAHGFVGQRL